jgi:ribosome-associated toxin RatA of RatAB toxin-antitoxin module
MIEIRLVEGPFKRLQGFWRFDPLGDSGCKVSLDIEFEFASRMLSLVVGPVFNQIANSLVDSFQKRALEVYGRR